jgi:hypothetical protein
MVYFIITDVKFKFSFYEKSILIVLMPVTEHGICRCTGQTGVRNRR